MTDLQEGTSPSQSSTVTPDWRHRLARFSVGALLVGVGLYLYTDLGLAYSKPGEPGIDWYVILCALGGLLYLTRLRPVAWWFAGVAFTVYLLVAHTRLTDGCLKACIRRDPLLKSDAVVVISGGVNKEGRVDPATLDRIITGTRVVRHGYAPILVRTWVGPPAGSSVRDEQELSELTGISPSDVVGPVRSTVDEARLVKRLATARHWKRIILVTTSWHTRRAAAVFEAAGLTVISCPAPERDFAISQPCPKERTMAFRLWLTEAAKTWYYRMRGWI